MPEFEIRIIESHKEYRQEFTKVASPNFPPAWAIILRGESGQPHRILIDGESIPPRFRPPLIEHEKLHGSVWDSGWEEKYPKLLRPGRVEDAAEYAAEKEAESLGIGEEYRQFRKTLENDSRYTKWWEEWKAKQR